MGIAISNKRGHSKSAARNRRHLRVRKRVEGTAGRPRLVVSRSLRHMVVQVIFWMDSGFAGRKHRPFIPT